jgi:hypothetical protein
MTSPFHHVVPKFLLRGFASADGKVAVFDINSGERRRSPPRSTAGEGAFYDFPVVSAGSKAAEELLQQVESDAARVVKKVCEKESILSLTDTDRMRLVKFVVVQSFRTRAFFRGMQIEDANRRSELFSQLWHSSLALTRIVAKRPIILMRAAVGSEFLIGDHPVALQNLEHPGLNDSLGLDLPAVEAFLPLSPLLALWLPPRAILDEITQGYERARTLHREVRVSVLAGRGHPMANEIGIRAIQRALNSGAPLHEACATGRPLAASLENVVNFNSLQLLFAEAEVYSRSGDFGLVRHILQQSPSYGRAVPTSVTLFMPGSEGA